MSDLLCMWAQDQVWGGPAEKLVVMAVAKESVEPDHIAYDATEEMVARYAEISVHRTRRLFKILQHRGHLVLVVGPEGPGYMLGAVFRRERIVWHFPSAAT